MEIKFNTPGHDARFNADTQVGENKNTKTVDLGLVSVEFDPAVLLQNGGVPPEDFMANLAALEGAFVNEGLDFGEAMEKFNAALQDVQAGGALEALQSLLGELGIGTDLSELMVEFAAMGRQNALDQRLASREQAKDELMSQADTTRTAAVTQAIVAGVAFVASVASFGVSVGGAKAASKTADAVADAVASGGDQATLAALNTSAAATQASNQAATQAINMTGQLAQGTGSVISGNVQADGQVDAANAQIEQSNSDLAKKVMDDFEEIVRATIQFLKEMQQAETDLMANMTRV